MSQGLNHPDYVPLCADIRCPKKRDCKILYSLNIYSSPPTTTTSEIVSNIITDIDFYEINQNSSNLIDDDDDIKNNNCYSQLPKIWQSSLVCGDFECQHWTSGWSMESSNSIVSVPQIIIKKIIPDFDLAYEGSSFAILFNESSILQSLPIRFPTFSNSTIYNQLTLSFYLQLINNFNNDNDQSSSDSSSSFSIEYNDEDNQYADNNENIFYNDESTLYVTLNDSIILEINTSSLILNQYERIDINVTDFANGENYILNFKFDNLNQSEQVTIDLINIISSPSVLIENDIYVSMNGNDFNGTGTIDKPFCSIARALTSIASGYTVYIMNTFKLNKINNATNYFLDTMAKNISLASYPLDQVYHINGQYNHPIIIATGPMTTLNISNIYLAYGFTTVNGQGGTVTLGPHTNLTFINSTMYFSSFKVLPYDCSLTGVLSSHYGSYINIINSDFSMNFGTIFFLRAESFTIFNSTFSTNDNGVSFSIFNENHNFAMIDCNLKDIGNLFYAFRFNQIHVNNTNFDGIIAYTNYLEDVLFNGSVVLFSNCTFENPNYQLTIHAVAHVHITLCTFDTITMNVDSFLLLKDGTGRIYISNCTFMNTASQSNTLLPLITIKTGDYLMVSMRDTTFFNNSCPLISMIDNSFLMMERVTIIENPTNLPLISMSQSYLVMINSEVMNNPAPFLTSYVSVINITESNFFTNSYSDYLPTSLIQLDSPVFVSLYKDVFMGNTNFHLIKIRAGTRCILEALSFMVNSVGQLISISTYSSVVVKNISTFQNFLATAFPIDVIDHSHIFVEDSEFFENTQAINVEDSTFVFSNNVWDSIYTTNNRDLKTFSITNSVGNFTNCTYQSSNPSGGIVAVNSNVNILYSKFSDLASSDSPVAKITDSVFNFLYCTFEKIQSGQMMINSLRSTLTFYDSSFTNITSPVTNFLGTIESLVEIDTCIFYFTQGNRFGFDLYNSNILIRDTIFFSNTFLFGAFILHTGGTFEMTRCKYTGNQALITLNSVKNATINETVFHNNRQDNTLILVYYSNLSILGTNFTNNGSPHQITMIDSQNSNLNIHNCIFHQPVGVTIGSGIRLTQGGLYISKSTFSLIYTTSSLLQISEAKVIRIKESKFIRNFGFAGGVALFSSCRDIIISGTLFIYNAAYSEQSSITPTIYLPYAHFGAVFLSLNSTMWAYDNTYHFNYAIVNGGVIANYNSTSMFTNSRFVGNQIYYGSGAVCYSNTPTCFIGNCTDQSPCENSNSLENSFSENIVVNGYGKFIASGPTSMSIKLLNYDKIHPNTSFIILVSEYDDYHQSVSLLSYPISLSLSVYLDDGSLFDSYNIPSTMQGYFTKSFSIDLPIGTRIHFIANATNGFHSKLSMNLTSCEPGYMPSPTTNTCILCPTGSYGWDGKSCYSCANYHMSQVICPGGSSITAMPGWWILPNSYPAQIYGCDPNICQLNQCREFQGGTLCSKCDYGYTKVKIYCEYCPEGVNLYLLSGMIVFYFIYLLLMTAYRLPSATAIFNFLSCIQVVSVISFDIRYVLILPLFNFNVDFWPTTCLTDGLNFIYKKVISLIMLVIITVFSSYLTIGKDVALALFSRFSHYIVENRFNNELFYILFSQIITIYTPLAFIALSLVSCYKIGDEYVLSLDVSVQCYTTSHYPLFGIAIGIIIFILIGAPLFIFIQVRRENRYYLKNFCKKYRPGYQYWDMVIMARSLCFVVTTITTIYNLNTKALILSTLGLVYTCMNWLLAPFKEKSLNDLETHFGLLLCICSMVFNSRALNNSSIPVGAIISSIGLVCILSIVYYLLTNIRSKSAIVSMEKDWGIKNKKISINK